MKNNLLMKTYMKPYVIFLISALLFSSCVVGKKKYQQLQADKLKVDDQLQALTTNYIMLNTKYDSLAAKFKELEKKKKELAETSQTELEKLNAELQTKIDLLEASNKKVTDLQAAVDKQKAASELLLSKIKNALTGFTSDELTVEMKDGKVYVSLSEQLLFPSGSSTVNKKGKEALAKVGEVLAKQSDIDINIEGHTDNVPLKGTVIKDNWDLSVMRATAIVRILTVDYGVNPKQIIPSGRADNFPVADNSTAEGKAKNRRTEIILAPKISELMKIIENK
jgi:chemotaxis protein MotB